VRRFIWSQLLHRRSRTATLGVGILVAAVGFTLLTSAVETGQLKVVGTVSRSFRPAYDILVRPPGSFTPLELEQGLVQQNYLSGIFGGITLRQWRTILKIPGVEVAAPIANIGYVMPFQFVALRIDRFLNSDPVQLYRLRLEWLAHNGSSTYPDSTQYVYLTRDHPFSVDRQAPGGIVEDVPGEGQFPVCSGFIQSKPEEPAESPFALGAGSGLACFSGVTPEIQGETTDYGPLPAGQVGTVSTAFFPIFVAAVDPAQEEQLLHIDQAVVAGRMLQETDAPRIERKGPRAKYRVVPFIASTRTFVSEELQVTVERLALPEEPRPYRNLSSEDSAFQFVTSLDGQTVGRATLPIGPMYERLVEGLSKPTSELEISYNGYWTTAPVRYRPAGPERLVALAAHNPTDVFISNYYGGGWAPGENRDTQFRRLEEHQGSTTFLSNNVLAIPALQVVGRFDPQRLPGFSPLSRVPLETYYPARVIPADPASRTALGDQPLLPTQNLGDYIQQPPLLVTTLRSLSAFDNPDLFEGASPKAPISVVRVRVAGVEGPDPVSRERIRRVAEAIQMETGLSVDVTAGSSPHPLLVHLPPGKFGRPSLLVEEGWVKKGVAVVILNAVDRKSLALFALVLVVTTLFLVNGALASVRARRTEIGTLLALGWSRGHIFRAVLGELALIGLAAGLAGTGIAAVLVRLFGFGIPLSRTLLVAPVAMVLASVAGLVPAWRAARSSPLDAVRSPMAKRRSVHHVRRIGGMALANLRRLPGRTLLAAAGLFVGVGALALLLSITLAFKGSILGTALGAFISIEVRGVDYVGVALAVVLAALSVADVLFLNLRERAPELVTLRAMGWRERDLGRMVALEGLGIGLLGSVAGATAGIGLSALVGGSPGRIVLAGAIAAVAGTAIALAAALVPASLMSRMTPPAVLAEE